jgi:hypothetical protein
LDSIITRHSKHLKRCNHCNKTYKQALRIAFTGVPACPHCRKPQSYTDISNTPTIVPQHKHNHDSGGCRIAKYILRENTECTECKLHKCTNDNTAWERYALGKCHEMIRFYKLHDDGGEIKDYVDKYTSKIIQTWITRKNGYINLFKEYGLWQ